MLFHSGIVQEILLTIHADISLGVLPRIYSETPSSNPQKLIEEFLKKTPSIPFPATSAGISTHIFKRLHQKFLHGFLQVPLPISQAIFP